MEEKHIFEGKTSTEAIEKGLKKVDLYGFIDFCCKNQKYIIRLDDLVL